MEVLQAFTMDVNPAAMLSYAADVVGDLLPLAMAIAGVFMGVRIYRSIRR